MIDPALWSRLQAHEFDAADASQPFSRKLASAEGWDRLYTDEVIEEYRRFLYLTQVSDGQVTPSIAVDRAWHMHLTFTRNYWDQLCPDVLGGPLHHEPCAGAEEMPRYRRQFVDTKGLYEQEFGHLPPANVWGPVAGKPRPGVGLYGVSVGVILLFVDIWVAAAVILCAGGLIVWDIYRKPSKHKRKKDGGGSGGFGAGGCSGGRSSGDGDGGGAGGCGGGCGGGG